MSAGAWGRVALCVALFAVAAWKVLRAFVSLITLD